MRSGIEMTFVKARLWHLHFGLSDWISTKILFEILDGHDPLDPY